MGVRLRCATRPAIFSRASTASRKRALWRPALGHPSIRAFSPLEHFHRKCKVAFLWGGSPDPRPTPWSALSWSGRAGPGGRRAPLWSNAGVRPTSAYRNYENALEPGMPAHAFGPLTPLEDQLSKKPVEDAL